MLRKVIVSIILVSCLIVGAWGLSKWLIAHRPVPHRVAVGARAPLVQVVTVDPRDIREVLYGFGTVRADRQATLRAEVAAAVVELVDNLEAGMEVKAGQVLVRLDDRQYRQELEETRGQTEAIAAELAQLDVERSNLGSLLEIAESDLALNRDELDRVRSLFEADHAPKTEYDDARLLYQESLRQTQVLKNQMALIEPRRMKLAADRSAADARAERAQLNIDRCRITAPFAGSVADLSVDVGDRLQVGSEILRLVNLDRIEIPIELPVSRRPRLTVGAAVDLFVESMPDVHWHGAVTRVAPTADERSRTFEAYVEVDNRDHGTPLLPGYFVRAEVDGPLLADALVVPRSAIVDGQVFVVNDEQAHARQVTVDRYIGEDAVITGEVEPGARVVTSNLDILYDEAPVRVRGASDTSTQPATQPASTEEATS